MSEHGDKHLLAGTYVLLASETSPPRPASAVLHPSETPSTSSLTPHVAFQVASYDASKPLIIDPVLSWATYLGGSGNDQPYGIAVDTAGNAYVTGYTTTPGSGFPGTAGSLLQSTYGGNTNAFVTKLNAAGTALVYSTYLGGSDGTIGHGIAVDGAGNAYVTGYTGSGLPGTAGSSIQSTLGGGSDAFVTKLNAAGTALVYSTYLGGIGIDTGWGIAVDTAGNAYVTGDTTGTSSAGLFNQGPGFPGTASSLIQSTFDGHDTDAFVTKLNAAGTALVYSTYLGAIGIDTGFGIAVDASGNAYVTGYTTTRGSDFPGTAGSLIQSTSGGSNDAFVTKLNAAGTALVYSTYLGGNGNDIGRGIAVDGAGNAYVTGDTSTLGSNFPGTAGSSIQSTSSGSGDAFVTKLNAAGTALVYSTYLGGSGSDTGFGIAVDASGNAYVTGYTEHTEPTGSGFPGTAGSSVQSTYGGSGDAFVTKLNAAGTALVSSTYLGGSGSDSGIGIAVDTGGNAYVTGNTQTPGSGFPGTAGSSIQSTFGGGGDTFVAKISFTPTANAGPDQSVPEGTLVTLDGTGSSGDSLTYMWTQVPGIPTAALSGATSAHPTFSAPHVPAAGGTVTFKLVVCEGTSSNCSDPGTVNVHIINVNHPPVADAGPDQTVQEGSPVMLDGRGSYDPDVESFTYEWKQILGPAVTVLGGNTAQPTFVAPTVVPAGATIVFDLTVTDPHTLTGSDSVSVFVTHVNQIPVANAGLDQTVNESTQVTLNGTGSTDPDLDALSYSWTQIAGPSVALTGGTTANPTFTAPSVGAGGTTLTFRLVVSDGQVNSVVDTVNIHVLDTNDPPVCTLAQPSVVSLWPPNHIMVPVTIMGVTDPNNQAITFTFTAVTQDEPVKGLGDGDTSPDAAVSGNQILLRAERSGTGNGRVYAVHFTATDDQGASCSGTVKVSVPHSKQDLAGEGPQAYNSFAP